MKNIVFVVLLFLGIGWVHVKWMPAKPLAGEEMQQTIEGQKSWWNGNLQAEAENELRNELAMFEHAVRLRNQIQWEALGKLNSSNTTVCSPSGHFIKQGVAFAGVRKSQRRRVNEVMRKWRKVFDWLEGRGKFGLFIVAANKHHALPTEALLDVAGLCSAVPGKWLLSNQLQNGFVENQLPHIMCGPWFRQMADTLSYPLFPKYGTHWSIASNYLVADSVMRRMEQVWSEPLPRRIDKGGEWDTIPRKADADLLRTMNLLKNNFSDSLWYPDFEWRFTDVDPEKLPRVLRIGDSFGEQVQYYGQLFVAFRPRSRLFYYNREDVRYSLNEDGTTEKSISSDVTPQDIQRELLESDGLIVGYSEITFLRHSEIFFRRVEDLIPFDEE